MLRDMINIIFEIKESMIKVIIAGGRNFENYALLKFKCNAILKDINDEIQIVSGGAKGADALGERYAKEKRFICKRFEADWDKNGRAAGPIRSRSRPSSPERNANSGVSIISRLE